MSEYRLALLDMKNITLKFLALAGMPLLTSFVKIDKRANHKVDGAGTRHELFSITKVPEVAVKKPITYQAFYSNDISTEIKNILEYTNKARAKAGLPLVTLNNKLMRAAHDYALAMNANEEMSHNVKGQTLDERINTVGYPWRSIGENVALNSDLDGRFVVERQWMRSEGHRRNILSPKFTEIGIGISGPSRGRRVYYYCQVFGRSR